MPHFVSVIVAARNAEDDLRILLPALQAQTFPADAHEVIIINNGSTDRTADVAKEFGFTVLDCADGGQTVAQNAGAKIAKGDLLVFTDADCNPEPDWLQKGVEQLQRENGDLGGGKIIMDRSDPNSAAQVCDALSFLYHEDMILRRHGLCGASMFISRPVFDALGGFWEDTISSADYLFGYGAYMRGYKLLYLNESVTHHPARGMHSLVRKALRLGWGNGAVWCGKIFGPLAPGKLTRVSVSSALFRNLNLIFFRQSWDRVGIQGSTLLFIRAWVCCWLLCIVGIFGALTGFVQTIPVCIRK